MASIKTLNQLLEKDHISNGDVRYMAENTKLELIQLTSRCTGSVRERLYWLKNSLNDYPSCNTCNNLLSSKNFQVNAKGGRYPDHCSQKCAMRNEGIAEKRKSTNLKLYGSEYYLASSAARSQIEKTNLDRYGNITPSPWGSSRFKQQMFDKHGVENSRQIQKINEKIIRNQIIANIASGKTEHSIAVCEARHNVECQNVELALDINREKLENVDLIWKHSECGKTYTSRIIDGDINVCEHCHASASVLELSLRAMILELTNEEVKFKVRGIIPKRELDIYIPSRKLAIEFNGIYWHSVLRNANKYYHLSKTEECEKLGIKLIHVWEHDFIQHQNLVKSFLGNALGISKKVDARKCTIKVITSVEAYDFCNKNHLDGGIKAKVNIGLFLDKMLIAVMAFGLKRFERKKQKNSWEIYRFCTLMGYQIRGGASKLFKHFIRKIKPKKVTSFCDRSLGGGDVYLKLGMVELPPTTPGYFWANTGSDITISRYKAQKKKLGHLLGRDFDPKLSEVDNMKRLGWFKLWDCGNRVFMWTPDSQ